MSDDKKKTSKSLNPYAGLAAPGSRQTPGPRLRRVSSTTSQSVRGVSRAGETTTAKVVSSELIKAPSLNPYAGLAAPGRAQKEGTGMASKYSPSQSVRGVSRAGEHLHLGGCVCVAWWGSDCLNPYAGLAAPGRGRPSGRWRRMAILVSIRTRG
jgi:hypothetical protein